MILPGCTEDRIRENPRIDERAQGLFRESMFGAGRALQQTMLVSFCSARVVTLNLVEVCVLLLRHKIVVGVCGVAQRFFCL